MTTQEPRESMGPHLGYVLSRSFQGQRYNIPAPDFTGHHLTPPEVSESRRPVYRRVPVTRSVSPATGTGHRTSPPPGRRDTPVARTRKSIAVAVARSSQVDESILDQHPDQFEVLAWKERVMVRTLQECDPQSFRIVWFLLPTTCTARLVLDKGTCTFRCRAPKLLARSSRRLSRAEPRKGTRDLPDKTYPIQSVGKVDHLQKPFFGGWKKGGKPHLDEWKPEQTGGTRWFRTGGGRSADARRPK